jgi:hypothetical protein
MLTKSFAFLDPSHLTPELIDRIRSLADACTDLRINGAVPDALLQSAPKLDGYFPVVTPQGLRLIGEVSGHPLLPGQGRRIITSQLWLADPNDRWVRTLSRFYRLGRAADYNHARTWFRDPFDDLDWSAGGHA